MSDTKTKQMAGLFTGFSTGTGLRLWLFFLFTFYFLGYPVPFSILLGFAGGLAGGWIMGWWKSKEGPREVLVVDEEQGTEQLEEKPTRSSGLRAAKERRQARARKRSQGSSLPFSGFLRR